MTGLRRPALLLAPLVASAAACTPPPWITQPPKFPAAAEIWDLPLYEPLTRLGPHIVATAVGRPSPSGAARSAEVLLHVDTGSSQTGLTAETFARLGVETSTSRFVSIEDAAGAKHGWSGAVVPELRLGSRLAIAGVVTSVTERVAVLGADVLAARGWRLDLDEGLLSLGAAPWPPAPDLVVLPTKRWRDHAIVDLRIAGREVPLLVDTGAPFTVVEDGILRRLGLREDPLASRWPLGGAGETVNVATSFEAEVALGGRALGVRRIFAHPSHNLSVGRGMLGNDILYTYAFELTPAGLTLKPRASDLVASAPRRIARWSDLPSCAGRPGCLSAELVAATARTDAPHLRVRFRALPPRPFRYLLGCLDAAGRLRPSPLWIEIAVRSPPLDTDVDVPVAPEVPAPFRRLWADGCARLTLLDANPIVDGARPLPATAEAHLATEVRGLTFR